jgi:hypothetical protein
MARVEIQVADVVPVLRLCVEQAPKTFPHMRVDISGRTGQYSIGLLLTVIDHGRSVVALANAGADSAIPVIARSCLEAYVDLVNLCDKPGYWKHLFTRDTGDWKDFFDVAHRGDNPSLTAWKGLPELAAARKMYAKQLQEAFSEGGKRLSVAARFKHADLKHDYEATYALLCAVAHNNVSTFLNRYFYAEEEEDQLKLREPGKTYPRALRYEAPCVLTTAEMVLRSTEKVLRHCGHGTAMLSEANAALDRMHEAFKREAEVDDSEIDSPGQ